MILHRIAANEDDIILLGEIGEEMGFNVISIYTEPPFVNFKEIITIHHIWLQGHRPDRTKDQIYRAFDDTFTARKNLS